MRIRVVLLFVLAISVFHSGGLSAERAGGTDGWAKSWREGQIAVAQPGQQKGWLGEAIEPEQWVPVEQPELGTMLEAAPALELEDVAPPPERCWCGHQPYLVPNPDGQSWDMVFPYFNKYRGEQEVVIHDFGTGKTSKQGLSTGRGDSVLTREAIGFHMQPSYYARGKLFFVVYGPVLFVVYDPAADRFVHGAKPFGDDVTNGRAVLGEDGMFYGMGWDENGFVPYRIDTETYEAKRFPSFGPTNEHRSELYRQVVMFGDWLYAGMGHRPWHLVAFNFRTGEGRLLATSDAEERGRAIRLTKMKGGVKGRMNNPVSVQGLEGISGSKFDFWLHEGSIYIAGSEVPPWSDTKAEQNRSGRYSWAREYQRWGSFVPTSQPPGFKRDAGDPDAQGQVELPYRMPGQDEWSLLQYKVKMYPGKVKLLTEVSDHVLFATDEGYGQHVFYDLKARRIMRVGGTLSPYSTGLFQKKMYVSGYPSSQMYEYDFSRPVGLKQAVPNPRFLDSIARKSDTHCPLAGTVAGADGRVYCAGTTYGRKREGGGFGWYDPATDTIGGMPLGEHRIFWMTTADDGRYILLSSKVGSEGQLFCWDTRTQSFAYQKAILGGGRPGPIEEVLPGGLVIGHHDKGLLYGLSAKTGEVLWEKAVPEGPITSFSQVRRHAYTFRRGPKGYLWCFLGQALVRIDPRDARVDVIGRMRPSQLAFVGEGIYAAGGNRLQRLKLQSR